LTEITSSTPAPARVQRGFGVFSALMMGLGSIIGTGVFVSIGIAAGIAGPAMLISVVLAALLAAFNGLSSAQLAAAYPISGGTYEYGYRHLSASAGFIAGWLFLCARGASAATAALGLSGYVLSAVGIYEPIWRIGFGLLAVIVVTLLVLNGTHGHDLVNVAVVMLTTGTLVFFILAGLPGLLQQGEQNFSPFFVLPSAGASPIRTIFHAAALLFVAYTGYGRVAALGENVPNPQRTIPVVILLSLLISMLLYLAVSVVAIGNVGAGAFNLYTLSNVAPLEIIARQFDIPGASWVMLVGAVIAMLGLLLNLMRALSRVMLAMGRRLDMPAKVAKVNRTTHVPEAAIVAVAILVALLVLIGDIATVWAFSAFTALMYYAMTNLVALQLPPDKRRYPPIIAMIGLLGSLFLAFWVEPAIWLSGIGLVLAGLVWQRIMHRL
jgi:basic amino acid/polyamine antiporter, APA family